MSEDGHRVEPPSYLSDPLPQDLSRYEPPAGSPECVSDGTQLIVVSGVPGSGKSTLADAVGRDLGIPVFAMDWVLGALSPFGFYGSPDALAVGEELLTHLALRQLLLDQSAILDHPTEEPSTRRRWLSLAQRLGAGFKVVWCVCSDERLHRQRLEQRSRSIPGWHDAGHWPNVVERLRRFPAWNEEALRIDTSVPSPDLVADVRRYLGRAAP